MPWGVDDEDQADPLKAIMFRRRFREQTENQEAGRLCKEELLKFLAECFPLRNPGP